MKGYTKPLLIILSVLLLDQIIKFWVKLHMTLGQEFKIIGNKALIHFTENNGMAFGMEFGGEAGKLALSVFRILAVFGIGYGLVYMIKRKYNRGLILCVSLIFAGALGNIIDSTFYGIVFSESTWYDKAQFLPEAGGYSSLFHGKVVDMFYFPLLQGTFPSWFPLWSNEEFIFFRPVFNLADSAISLGVIIILIFQKRYFKEEVEEPASYHSEIIEE